jgi:hypothetical protein
MMPPSPSLSAHDKADVFGCDYDHQRPEHQRQEAQDRLVPGVARRFETFAEGIDRARSDIADGDTGCADNDGRRNGVRAAG